MTINIQSTQLAVPVTADDHVIGPEDAPVTLVEYADYQCPYCAGAEATLDRVRRELADTLRFVFRNFPLIQAHPYALQATAAAESAGLQGKFWEMHDELFKNQQSLDEGSLLYHAGGLGLDVDRFAEDMQSYAVVERIRHDIEGARWSGVEGTPSFFINGWKYEGSWDYESLVGALTAVA
jgi:protein-disulfide isomerase